jgi:hypothetical protein
MKKKLLIFAFASLLLIILSCNRQQNDVVEVNNLVSKSLLVHYLEEQKLKVPSASTFIDTLITNSDWKNISKSTITSSIELFYVPLTYNSNNIGIVFLYNINTQQVYYCHIAEVQNAISNNSIPRALANQPKDFLVKFYRYNINDFTGSIRAYSISNNFLWEYGYTNGKKLFEKTITTAADFQSINNGSQVKTNSIVSNNQKLDGCLDWYIVT